MGFSSILQMMFNAWLKPKQRISIAQIPHGRVLDIGGGGEGVIAQAGGARVVAVDKRISEIHEARGKASGAAWLAADAGALPCNDRCFDNATAFFSCMYMPDAVKERVFGEARRVLKPSGEFWIWDARMAPTGKGFAIRLQVNIRGARPINTLYGVRAKDQSVETIGRQLRQAGFEWKAVASHAHWFLIKARKE